MKYAVLLKADIDSLSEVNKTWLFNQIREDNPSSLREGLTGTAAEGYCIVKWSGGSCPCLTLGLAHTDYDYAGILALIGTSDWSSEENL